MIVRIGYLGARLDDRRQRRQLRWRYLLLLLQSTEPLQQLRRQRPPESLEGHGEEQLGHAQKRHLVRQEALARQLLRRAVEAVVCVAVDES